MAKSKKLFAVNLERSTMLDFQRLALDLDRFVNDMMEEAMKDFMAKYRKKPLAKREDK